MFSNGLTLSLHSSPAVRDVADRAGMSAPVVKKKELAKLLKISRQTLDLWIERWDQFPVLERGTNGREWQFDPAAVTDFLRARREEERQRKEARDEALAQLSLPLDDDEAMPGLSGLSAADRLRMAQLAKLQREEAERLGKLVRRDEIEAALVEGLPELLRAVRDAARGKCIEFRMPDEETRRLDGAICAAWTARVRELQVRLGKSELEAYIDG